MPNIINELVRIINTDEKKRVSFINAVKIRLEGNKKLLAEFKAALEDFSMLENTEGRMMNAAQTKELIVKTLLNKGYAGNEIDIVNLSENNLNLFLERIAAVSGLARGEMIAAKKELKIDGKWIKASAQEKNEVQKELNIFAGNKSIMSVEEFDAVKKRAINLLTKSIEAKRRELEQIRENILKINQKLPKDAASLTPAQVQTVVKLRKVHEELSRLFSSKREIYQRELNIIKDIASGSNLSDTAKKILNKIAAGIAREKAALSSEERALQEIKKFGESLYSLNQKQLENLNQIKSLLSKTGGIIGVDVKENVRKHLGIILKLIGNEIFEIKKILSDSRYLEVVDRQLLILSKEAAAEMVDLIQIILGSKGAAIKSELGKITGTDRIGSGETIEHENELIKMLEEMGIRPK